MDEMKRILLKIKNKLNNNSANNGNRQIVQLTYFFSIIFILLMTYICVIVYRDSDEIINNSYNKREAVYSAKTLRGSILSSDGDILACTNFVDGNELRIYPYGRLFSHVVGYNVRGKAGVESIANFRLLKSNALFTERIINDLNGIKNVGDNVVTSLDLKTQYAAYEALGNRKGAVVVMDARNGYIISMVSKPDFDPNEVEYTWNEMTNDENNSVLLNRATSGLYPPGSTFKIITALEYIKENNIEAVDNYNFECNGYFEYKGTKINCFHGKAHGDVNFDDSFAQSCNSSFAKITTTLDKSDFEKTCKEFLFGDDLPGIYILNNKSSFPIKKSLVSINSKSSVDELLQTGIGQGKTSITPYHMCLISAAIANDGVLMKPILVKEIETSSGNHIESVSVRPYKRLLSEEDSDKVKGLMREVVTDGTGTILSNTVGYEAYGKTGSAEFSTNKSESHAWFTGFAEGENGSLLAISVIVENGGSGGQVAAPIARAVFDAYYN